MHDKKCKNCNLNFKTKDHRAKFCSRKCSTFYNNKRREKPSKEQRLNISNGLKSYWKNNPDKIRRGEEAALSAAKSTRGKYKERYPESILELSKRTVQKILTRLKIGCCICGWNESSCDIHHIEGKKIENPNAHSNLTYICPNHHRMIHNNLVSKETVETALKLRLSLHPELYLEQDAQAGITENNISIQ